MDSAIPASTKGRRRSASEPLARARFEVRGLDRDRALIRTLAQRLAEDGPEAKRLRTLVADAVAPAPKPTTGAVGGILAALLASPIAGSRLDLEKTRHPGRDVDL